MVSSKPSDPRITVTSSEAAGRKHLVEPYSDQPIVDGAARGRICALCGNPGFRRSRLRFTDLHHMLLLKFPVRCTRCGRRQYMGLGVASGSTAPRPQSAAALRESAERADSWQVWTEQNQAAGQTAAHSDAVDPASVPGVEQRPSGR